MAKTVTYEWAVGKWEDRATLSYISIDQKIDDKKYTCDLPFGSNIGDELPVKTEDTGANVYYITYSSSDTSAIIRITELEG